jgi:hypothetical protein
LCGCGEEEEDDYEERESTCAHHSADDGDVAAAPTAGQTQERERAGKGTRVCVCVCVCVRWGVEGKEGEAAQGKGSLIRRRYTRKWCMCVKERESVCVVWKRERERGIVCGLNGASPATSPSAHSLSTFFPPPPFLRRHRPG